MSASANCNNSNINECCCLAFGKVQIANPLIDWLFTAEPKLLVAKYTCTCKHTHTHTSSINTHTALGPKRLLYIRHTKWLNGFIGSYNFLLEIWMIASKIKKWKWLDSAPSVKASQPSGRLICMKDTLDWNWFILCWPTSTSFGDRQLANQGFSIMRFATELPISYHQHFGWLSSAGRLAIIILKKSLHLHCRERAEDDWSTETTTTRTTTMRCKMKLVANKHSVPASR